VRGRWGGPPGGGSEPAPAAARDLAFAPRGDVELAQLVAMDIPEIDVKAAGAAGPADKPDEPARKVDHDKPGKSPEPPKKDEKKKGCGCDSGADAGSGAFVLLGLMAIMTSRRRSRRLAHLHAPAAHSPTGPAPARSIVSRRRRSRV
jgi:MYXO-CTERM domain-containing protein